MITEIVARFSNREKADAAVSALRSHGITFNVKGISESGEMQETLNTALPFGISSANELTGSNANIFPASGGRAIMQLEHGAHRRETIVRINIDAVSAEKARSILRQKGAAF